MLFWDVGEIMEKAHTSVISSQEQLRQILISHFDTETVEHIFDVLNPLFNMTVGFGFDWGDNSIIPESIIQDINFVTGAEIKSVDCVSSESVSTNKEYLFHLNVTERFKPSSAQLRIVKKIRDLKREFVKLFSKKFKELLKADYGYYAAMHLYHSLQTLVVLWLAYLHEDDGDSQMSQALENLVGLASKGCIFSGFMESDSDVAIISCK